MLNLAHISIWKIKQAYRLDSENALELINVLSMSKIYPYYLWDKIFSKHWNRFYHRKHNEKGEKKNSFVYEGIWFDNAKELKIQYHSTDKTSQYEFYYLWLKDKIDELLTKSLGDKFPEGMNACCNKIYNEKDTVSTEFTGLIKVAMENYRAIKRTKIENYKAKKPSLTGN